jgi:hypothetical protein
MAFRLLLLVQDERRRQFFFERRLSPLAWPRTCTQG